MRSHLARTLPRGWHASHDRVSMRLTMTGEYAIRAMIHLAGLSPGSAVQIADISDAWEIPETFLRKIAARLGKAGLLVSQRGLGGGIQLARPAESLTLLEVIEAIEGKITLNRCLMAGEFCHRTVWCQVHLTWVEAQEAVKTTLARKSLKQLAEESAGRQLAEA